MQINLSDARAGWYVVVHCNRILILDTLNRMFSIIVAGTPAEFRVYSPRRRARLSRLACVRWYCATLERARTIRVTIDQ